MRSPGSARRRGVVVGVVVAVVLAAVVLVAVLVVATLVAGEAPGSGWTIATVVAGAVTAGILAPWARRVGDRVVDDLVHGGRRDPESVVRAVGRRPASDLADDDLLAQVADSLLRGFRAASAAVWQDDGAGRVRRTVAVPAHAERVVTLDDGARGVLAGGGVVGRSWLDLWAPELLADLPTGEVRMAPATHGGALLGLVVVTRLAGAVRFDATEDASLAELGSRLGVLLHNRELDATLREAMEDLRRTNVELRASRGRLVTAADAERRRIERDLHDGAQQHLVALAVNLRLAADEITADPSAASTAFESLGSDVRAAIDELRSLAHGIYPPLLMDAGLVEALTAAARRSPSPATVRAADGVGRYPTDVEAAVYFCCVEALQNAAKHAPGAAVRITLDDEAGRLSFEVADEGPGFERDAASRGRGLDNMTDRIGAIGGTLVVVRGPDSTGGTVVRGVVPPGATGPVAATDVAATEVA